MPISNELLGQIKTQIDDAEQAIKEIEDVISDLRVSGIDATDQEKKLASVKAQVNQLRLFYSRQSKR